MKSSVRRAHKSRKHHKSAPVAKSPGAKMLTKVFPSKSITPLLSPIGLATRPMMPISPQISMMTMGINPMNIPYNIMTSQSTFKPNYMPPMDFSQYTNNTPNLLTKTSEREYPFAGKDISNDDILFGDYEVGKHPCTTEMIGGMNPGLFLNPFVDQMQLMKMMKYQHRDDPAVIRNSTGRSLGPLMQFQGHDVPFDYSGIANYPHPMASQLKYDTKRLSRAPHPTINMISQLQ